MKLFIAMSEVSEKWSAGGYKGLQDDGGQLKFGSRIRKDSRVDELLISSGGQADETIGFVTNIQEYKATRLDLQVTMQLDKPDVGMSSRMYEEICAKKSVGQSPVGRRRVSHVRSETGDTLYIGARKTGRKFYRFYDKGYDVGAKRGVLWRVEIQYGRDLAQEALARYISIKESAEAIISLVGAEFYDACGYDITDGGGLEAELISCDEKPASSVQKKLEWLETCVRPTIAYLIAQDCEDETREAVGLPVRPNCDIDVERVKFGY
jgi:hypothetical protein